MTTKIVGFCGVVVITSALHAEGREFEPRQNLVYFCLLLLYSEKYGLFYIHRSVCTTMNNI